ncbi:MAG: excinuclease ABC subunit UvrC [Firmicutes bacterium]|nr:excinuclease ABC subunit UvrC [Bacillota bacterium]
MVENFSEQVADRAAALPQEPGVYLFKDQNGEVIYVGKALSLRQRVRSYFQKSMTPSPRFSRRLQVLVAKIAALDFIVTDTEEEAFILEANLIKTHVPRYNIQFKDDKHYPYLRLNLQEPFPRLEVTRKVEGKGFKYFGPFSRAGAVKETVRSIKKLFPLRSCRRPLQAGAAQGRPCLNFQIKRCLAPCQGNVSAQEYALLVEQVVLFLEGRQEHLLKKMEKEMQAAADDLQFEKAARLRDQLLSLQKVTEQQKAVTTDRQDRDIIAVVELPRGVSVGLFKVRDGKLLGVDNFTPVTAATAEDAGEVMKEFLRHYYGRAAFIPGELLVSHLPAEKELLLSWLQKKRNNKKVKIRVPQRGEKKALLELLKKNVLLQAEEKQGQCRQREAALQELARVLSLPAPPARIEGYDISHLAGQETAGAMVVFLQGQAVKDEYRRFKIRTAAPGDDYAALTEMLQRRFSRGDWPRPALVLVDGGRGQLSAARSALQAAGQGTLPVVALAEKEEQLYLPGKKEPLNLPAVHPALQLLQRVRDEAHRFALSFSRGLQLKSSLASFLETVPGIGPVRRKALLQHFGGLEALRQASREEIAAVPGISSTVAAQLYIKLQQN